MGLLSRLFERIRGGGAPAADGGSDAQSLARPTPTPTMRHIPPPPPTPTTKPLTGSQRTAGTPTYGAPGGTPSTRRIHNPTRPGR